VELPEIMVGAFALAPETLGASLAVGAVVGGAVAAEAIIALTVGTFLVADGLLRLQGKESALKRLSKSLGGDDPFGD
jgi:hypothetical protein